MRHKVAGRRLGRTTSHRKATMQNMAVSLIQHELIRTTVPKAKELRRVAEPLITRAKEDSVANRRLVFNRLRDRDAVQKLFNELGPRYTKRPGGYLRILPKPALQAAFGAFDLRKTPAVLYLHPRELDPEQPRMRLPLHLMLRRAKTPAGTRCCRSVNITVSLTDIIAK